MDAQEDSHVTDSWRRQNYPCDKQQISYLTVQPIVDYIGGPGANFITYVNDLATITYLY